MSNKKNMKKKKKQKTKIQKGTPSSGESARSGTEAAVEAGSSSTADLATPEAGAEVDDNQRVRMTPLAFQRIGEGSALGERMQMQVEVHTTRKSGDIFADFMTGMNSGMNYIDFTCNV